MAEIPFIQIEKKLKGKIPAKELSLLPEKWERIGDIVILKLPAELGRYKEYIGEIYAEILQCKTVLQDTSGISGEYREPNVEIIYGSEKTETIHKENGIQYKLDPQRVMFSSGNMDERIRMAHISNEQETVVDLFAGIGYFSLPIAVYSKPKRIVACEINPVAFEYLRQNISLNRVLSIIQPFLGDNWETAPKNCADRVLMGYIKNTSTFLPLAMECLKHRGGVIHYHDVFPNDLLPERPMKLAEEIAASYKKTIRLLNYKQVKSYSPKVSHIVLDLQVV
jgi:tRNA wybutosine-synthesizing protein 2